MMSQWSGWLGGDSVSAAPATKSDTTASTLTPLPAMKMPVWPVARKEAGIPRRCNSRSMARLANILPTAQSVPTVSRRLPARLAPVAMGVCSGRG